MVLDLEMGGRRLAINVDRDRPHAWRDEPYYSQLKAFSAAAMQASNQVVVFIGRRAIVILPHDDVDLGEIADDELIATFQGFDGRPAAAKNKRSQAGFDSEFKTTRVG
jgi:hypothetical protein